MEHKAVECAVESVLDEALHFQSFLLSMVASLYQVVKAMLQIDFVTALFTEAKKLKFIVQQYLWSLLTTQYSQSIMKLLTSFSCY